MPPFPHPALILWLIRQGAVSTWSELRDYFNAEYTVLSILLNNVTRLQGANLIEVEGDIEEYIYTRRGRDDGRSPAISMTKDATDFLSVLDISLSQLAQSSPANRLIASPVFRKTRGTQYESDILVFMPFSGTLQPVYEDHLKSVAAKLNQSIKRADNFFTTHEVMDEIWTALLKTKVVIVDCTDRNPNVFYELGLAHVVGKPTVLITQNDDDIPFDLRHRRYIRYELTPRGMKSFEEALERTLIEALAQEEV